jgi:hypothetical protein
MFRGRALRCRARPVKRPAIFLSTIDYERAKICFTAAHSFDPDHPGDLLRYSFLGAGCDRPLAVLGDLLLDAVSDLFQT